MLDRAFYSLIKPVLLALDAERAHDVTLANLARISKSAFTLRQVQRLYSDQVPELTTTCMGLEFKHPIGLAAGLDKDAKAFNAFAALGFSGVEMGTVTPKPQPGNEKPRIFRLAEDRALINRMGFNSCGVEEFLANYAKAAPKMRNKVVAGINIGKNAVTPLDQAQFDYGSALQRVYSKADYITVNISSPNTKSLRDLQNANYLDDFLMHVKQVGDKCAKVHKRNVPIALKVAPDLTEDEVETISELVLSHRFAAVIATNTTLARPASLQSEHASQEGGLSGLPVKDASTEVIRQFYGHLRGRVQIVGVGGIQSAEDAWQKLVAGADYLQIYTLFIYQGPIMIREIVAGLKEKVAQYGCTNLAEALEKARQIS